MNDTFVPSLCKKHSEEFFAQAKSAGACPVCDLDHAAEVARLEKDIESLQTLYRECVEAWGMDAVERNTLAERVRVLEEAANAWRDLAHIQNSSTQVSYSDWMGYRVALESATVRAVNADAALAQPQPCETCGGKRMVEDGQWPGWTDCPDCNGECPVCGEEHTLDNHYDKKEKQ